jgi:hypothetical protein
VPRGIKGFFNCPYVAKLLAVVTLRKGILAPVRFHPDSDVAEAWQPENLLGFWSPWQGYQEEWEGNNLGFFLR